MEVVASVQGAELAAPFPLHEEVEHTAPARRMRGWRESIPAITVEETTEAVPIEGRASPKGAGDTAPAPPAKPGASTVTATVRVVFALE